jgi:hypothetical protein
LPSPSNERAKVFFTKTKSDYLHPINSSKTELQLENPLYSIYSALKFQRVCCICD